MPGVHLRRGTATKQDNQPYGGMYHGRGEPTTRHQDGTGRQGRRRHREREDGRIERPHGNSDRSSSRNGRGTVPVRGNGRSVRRRHRSPCSGQRPEERLSPSHRAKQGHQPISRCQQRPAEITEKSPPPPAAMGRLKVKNRRRHRHTNSTRRPKKLRRARCRLVGTETDQRGRLWHLKSCFSTPNRRESDTK
eukprot:Pompholyxophrys_punicea_v1_NODE_21_length_5692_cov_19.735675.p2 type:complete len:192 gc:universal NODE_21_length_5692_cov_19.735675:1267-1842(+)